MEHIKIDKNMKGKGPFAMVDGVPTDNGLHDDCFDTEAEEKYIKIQKVRKELELIEQALETKNDEKLENDLNESYKV